MKQFTLLVSAFLCLTILSCKQGPENSKVEKKTETAKIAPIPEGWKTLSIDNFSISHPADWTTDESGKMGTKVILFAPLENEATPFNENINVMTEDLPSAAITLDQYVKASEKQIKNFITDAKVETSEGIEINGQAFHSLIYSGKQSNMDLKFQQYFTVKDEKALILTLTTKVDTYDDYKEIGSQIMKTFKFN